MKTITKLLIAWGAVLAAVLIAAAWNYMTPSGTRAHLPASTLAPPDSLVISRGAVMIDLNLADAHMLSSLTTLTYDKAEAIVKWREANGRFESVEQAVGLFAGRSAKTADEMRARLIVVN